MTVKQQLKRIEIVPADEYEVVLVSVDEGEAGEHGPMWIWSFGISSGEYADVEITGVSSQTYSTYPSKSYKWAIAIGHPREVDFDASLIEGLPCRLSISVEEKPDAGERNRIIDVLAPTKAKVLERQAMLKGAGLEDLDKQLCLASGFRFYNTSRFDFHKLHGDAPNVAANLRNYIAGFSSNMREVLEKFDLAK